MPIRNDATKVVLDIQDELKAARKPGKNSKPPFMQEQGQGRRRGGALGKFLKEKNVSLKQLRMG